MNWKIGMETMLKESILNVIDLEIREMKKRWKESIGSIM